MNIDRKMLFGMGYGAVIFVLALGCFPGGGLGGDCDPEFDEDCVCTLDESGDETNDCIDGETAEGDFCTCETEGGFGSDLNPEPEPNPDPNPSPNPEPDAQFRFVLVEDLSQTRVGDFPGADIDAISVIKANGEEFFAESFEDDTEIDCTGNQACDPTSLLGEEDFIVSEEGSCPDPDLANPRFTSLNGGFVIVQFSSVANGDVAIENGDDVHVYEVGATECGRFDDDPFRVSVSVGDDITGSFNEIGEGGRGNNIIPISGL